MIPSTLPPFDLLKQHYDIDPDYNMVKKRIGGEVTQKWLGDNTCAMRVSKAFNYAGGQGKPFFEHENGFPKIGVRYNPGIYKIRKGHGMSVIHGADKLWYGFRVADIRIYLHRMYGKAQVIKERGKHIKESDFKDKQGIIAFDVKGWDDATGHVTLWDGEKVLYETEENEYFGMSRNLSDLNKKGKPKPVLVGIELWIC